MQIVLGQFYSRILLQLRSTVCLKILLEMFWQELDAVKGLGKILKQRILAARSEQLFMDWQDFIDRKIENIGPKRLQVIEDVLNESMRHQKKRRVLTRVSHLYTGATGGMFYWRQGRQSRRGHYNATGTQVVTNLPSSYVMSLTRSSTQQAQCWRHSR